MKEIRAADIARKLGVSPREARVALRAAGIKAPYTSKDVAKMTAIIRGPNVKGKAATGKPKKTAEAPAVSA